VKMTGIGQDELGEEAVGLLVQIFEEDSLAPHYSDDGHMYYSSAWLFTFMAKLGCEVEPEILKEATERMNEDGE